MASLYTVDTSYFDTIGPNQAYIIGLLFTDGCRPRGRNSVVLKLQARDKPILDKVKAELKYDGPLHFRPRRNPKHQDCFELNINNKKISSRLLELGMVCAKSLVLEYPTWLTEKTERHFIRGCIDGDGHISSLGNFKFYGTKSMCEGIAAALYRACMIEPKIKHKSRTGNNTYTLTIGRRREAKAGLSWLYVSSHLYIDRKKEEAMRQVGMRRPLICKIEDCGRTVYSSGLCFSHYRKERYKIKHPSKPKQLLICSVDGCNRPAEVKGLCPLHYQRQWKAKQKALRIQDQGVCHHV